MGLPSVNHRNARPGRVADKLGFADFVTAPAYEPGIFIPAMSES